jgi:nifR3 family TIM-barrel protein
MRRYNNQMFDWQQLPRPFFVLAPMEGVTDTVFRQVILHAGPPDVFMTEFISVEGYCSRGYPGMKDSLRFAESERPIIAQIWGYTPTLFEKTATDLVAQGYDGIDINMGCPDRSVMKKGCGAALIQNPALAAEIIEAVKQGVRGKVPVSVKTRIGVKEIVTDTWIPFLLDQKISALTVHGRTAKELSKVPAHWEEIGKAVNGNCVVIGNGDVMSKQDGKAKAAEFGVDGIMVGRGIFSNPWLFADEIEKEHSKQERFDLLQYHLDLFEATWQATKPVFTLRKFFKIYIQGFPGALDLRVKLMAAQTLAEIRDLLQ